MFSLLRRMRRDERGQALVIGAVAMLVLAVTVMASVSIGHGVHQKIKLQDAADAQAYSLAVKEARAYNFLAYTNRAMVVHYSAMLTFMSYVSHALYLDMTIGELAGVAKYIPGIGAIFAAVQQVIKAWKTAVDGIARLLIPLLSALNVALWLAQEAMMVGTLKDLLLTGGESTLTGTDPKSRPGPSMSNGPALSAIMSGKYNVNHSNLKNFLHVIDDGPRGSDKTFSLADPTGLSKRARLMNQNANKLSDPDMAKYRLLMGNLANGVRRQWTAVGKEKLLIGRQWTLRLCVPPVIQFRINKVADSQIKSFDEEFQGNRRDQLFASDEIKLEWRMPCPYLGRPGKGWKEILNVDFQATADKQGGFHQTVGPRRDDHHTWEGITPFLMTDTSFVDPWHNHFSAACNVTILSKDMRTTPQPFHLDGLRTGKGFLKGASSGRFDKQQESIVGGMLDITWNLPGGAQDTKARQFREETGGMMAMAVGRAIYHRPGDWKEEPNFFNPLWTARLAPAKTHWERDALSQYIQGWEAAENTFSDALNY